MTQSVTLADVRLLLLQFTTSNVNQVPRSLLWLPSQEKEKRQESVQKKEALGDGNRVLVRSDHVSPKDDPQSVDAQALPVRLLRGDFELVRTSVRRRKADVSRKGNEHYAIGFHFVQSKYARYNPDFRVEYRTSAFFGLESLLDLGLWKLRCYRNERSDDVGKWMMMSVNFDHRQPLVTPQGDLCEVNGRPIRPSHTLALDSTLKLVLSECVHSESTQPTSAVRRQSNDTDKSTKNSTRI